TAPVTVDRLCVAVENTVPCVPIVPDTSLRASGGTVRDDRDANRGTWSGSADARRCGSIFAPRILTLAALRKLGRKEEEPWWRGPRSPDARSLPGAPSRDNVWQNQTPEA